MPPHLHGHIQSPTNVTNLDWISMTISSSRTSDDTGAKPAASVLRLTTLRPTDLVYGARL